MDVIAWAIGFILSLVLSAQAAQSESPDAALQWAQLVAPRSEQAQAVQRELLLRTAVLALFPPMVGSTSESTSSGNNGGGGNTTTSSGGGGQTGGGGGGGGSGGGSGGGGGGGGGGVTVSSAPEPATLVSALLGGSLAGLALLWRSSRWRARVVPAEA